MAVTLLSASIPAQAGPTCKGLIGTWSATYTMFTPTPTPAAKFTDKFTLYTVDADGFLLGYFHNLHVMHGYCKNGIVYIAEVIGTDLMSEFYFANENKGFAQYAISGNVSGAFFHNLMPAKIKKISNTVSPPITDSTELDSINVLKQQILDLWN